MSSSAGALDGAQLHWAAAPGPHRGWGGVPGGWQTDPGDTRDAGVCCPALPTFIMQSVLQMARAPISIER